MIKSDQDPRSTASGVFCMAAIFSFFVALFWPHNSVALQSYFLVPGFPNLESLFWSVVSGICEGGYVFTLGLAFSRSSLGPAYAIMRGGAMLSVWAVSSIFLGEPLGLISFFGVVLILFGLILVHKKDSGWNHFTSQKWAYLSGMFIAGYHLCYGQALHQGAMPTCLFSVSMIVAVPLLILAGGKSQRMSVYLKIRSRPWLLITGGIMSTISFLVFLVGLSHSGAGYAISIRNTSVAFAQIFALFLGEKVTIRQWSAVLAILGGATLLAFI